MIRFSQQVDMKMHDVDEKLDELETLISIFEQKLDSLPPEVFSDMPQIEALPSSTPLTLTENPLGPPQPVPPPPPPPPQGCENT